MPQDRNATGSYIHDHHTIIRFKYLIHMSSMAVPVSCTQEVLGSEMRVRDSVSVCVTLHVCVSACGIRVCD